MKILSGIMQQKAMLEMMGLLSIVYKLLEIFDKKAFIQKCKQFGAIKRNRSFDFFEYFKIAIEKMSKTCGKLELADIARDYRYYTDSQITTQAIHKNLLKQGFFKVIKNICDELNDINEKLRYPNGIQACLFNFVSDTTGIKIIGAQDGTDITTVPRTVKIGATPKGNTKADGSACRPSVTAHVFTNDNNAVLNVKITASAEKGQGERKQIHPEEYKNTLILADRGYISSEVLKLISDSGNFYAIRGRENSSGIIRENYISDSSKVNIISKNFNTIQVKCGEVCDVSIEMNNGYRSRCIKAAIKDGRFKRIYILYTNIPPDKMTAEQLLYLYRIRWRISEITFKCLKSYNSFKSINSGKLDIIYLFFMFSLISYSLKEIFAKLTSHIAIHNSKNKDKLLKKTCSSIKIHKNISCPLFDFIRKLQKNVYSAIEFIYNFGVKHFFRDYIMDRLSKRDRDKLKGIEVLGQAIMNA